MLEEDYDLDSDDDDNYDNIYKNEDIPKLSPPLSLVTLILLQIRWGK